MILHVLIAASASAMMMATGKESHAVQKPLSVATEKPCRACTDFRSWMSIQKATSKSAKPGKINDGEATATDPTVNSSEKEGPTQETENNREGSNPSKATVTTDEDEVPLWGSAKKHGCPADSVGLGKGSWRLLHSMAAYYPTLPSSQEQQHMNEFIALFAKFYPCKPCAEDFREWLGTHPPAVDSQSSLSWWFCDAHNEVNRRLGKPLFDCRLVNQRWRDGWADGSCD